MQISVLRKLLHPKSLRSHLRAEKSKAQISESEAVSDMKEEQVYEAGYVEELTESSLVEEEHTESETAKTPASIVDEDIATLREGFEELSGIESITELPNPTRYAALRDLGLSPEEAYRATNNITRPNTKSHLTSSVPRSASAPHGSMTRQQLSDARSLFGDLSDTEIQKLYKRVNN